MNIVYNITATNIKANVQAVKSVKNCKIGKESSSPVSHLFNRNTSNDHEWPRSLIKSIENSLKARKSMSPCSVKVLV